MHSFNYTSTIEPTTGDAYDNPIVNHEKVCPNCHYCPTCGRGLYYYPQYIPTYPYPTYPNNTGSPFYSPYQIWC